MEPPRPFAISCDMSAWAIVCEDSETQSMCGLGYQPRGGLLFFSWGHPLTRTAWLQK